MMTDHYYRMTFLQKLWNYLTFSSHFALSDGLYALVHNALSDGLYALVHNSCQYVTVKNAFQHFIIPHSWT